MMIEEKSVTARPLNNNNNNNFAVKHFQHQHQQKYFIENFPYIPIKLN